MRRVLLVALVLAVLPQFAAAQVEIGVDGGLVIDRSNGSTVTQFSTPISAFRLSFPRESFTFESLISVNVISANDETVSILSLIPGLAFSLSPNVYLKGEVAITYLSGGGSSANQFGFGGAIGWKRQLGDGPVSVRLEGAVDQMLENDDFSATTEFRGTAGISAAVGG